MRIVLVYVPWLFKVTDTISAIQTMTMEIRRPMIPLLPGNLNYSQMPAPDW